MSRIFISGSSTGLGLMAAELLSSQGHQVVLHARNADRAADTRRASPKHGSGRDRRSRDDRGRKGCGRSGQCARPL